jgi:hypothetical protein
MKTETRANHEQLGLLASAQQLSQRQEFLWIQTAKQGKLDASDIRLGKQNLEGHKQPMVKTSTGIKTDPNPSTLEPGPNRLGQG